MCCFGRLESSRWLSVNVANQRRQTGDIAPHNDLVFQANPEVDRFRDCDGNVIRLHFPNQRTNIDRLFLLNMLGIKAGQSKFVRLAFPFFQRHASNRESILRVPAVCLPIRAIPVAGSMP